MKTIILNSLLAMFIIASILILALQFSPNMRSGIAAIVLTSVFAYVFYDRKKLKKVKID